ncbi:uncharacterized protein LOC144280549 isoform X3 [Canis aureus]
MACSLSDWGRTIPLPSAIGAEISWNVRLQPLPPLTSPGFLHSSCPEESRIPPPLAFACAVLSLRKSKGSEQIPGHSRDKKAGDSGGMRFLGRHHIL